MRFLKKLFGIEEIPLVVVERYSEDDVVQIIDERFLRWTNDKGGPEEIDLAQVESCHTEYCHKTKRAVTFVKINFKKFYTPISIEGLLSHWKTALKAHR